MKGGNNPAALAETSTESFAQGTIGFVSVIVIGIESKIYKVPDEINVSPQEETVIAVIVTYSLLSGIPSAIGLTVKTIVSMPGRNVIGLIKVL